MLNEIFKIECKTNTIIIIQVNKSMIGERNHIQDL